MRIGNMAGWPVMPLCGSIAIRLWFGHEEYYGTFISYFHIFI
jgi:hypothetical protein